MASLNKVFLIGNLTRDPEIRFIPSGKAVGDLRMAVNRRFRTSSGEDRDETCFVSVVVWGRQAETCGEYLKKGAPILVEGRLQYEEWEKDGQKNNRIRVVAERVQFLSSPRNAEFRDSRDDDGGGSGAARSGGPSPESADDTPDDDDNLPF